MTRPRFAPGRRLAPLYRAAALPVAIALMLSAVPRRGFAQVAPADDMPTRSAPAAAPTPSPASPPQTTPPSPTTAPTPSEPARQVIPEGAPPLPPGAVSSMGDGSPPRMRLRYEERRMTGLMVAGSCVLGGTWLMSAVFGGYVADRGWFALPIFGPIIYKTDDKVIYATMVLDTIVQASGLTMLLVGALVKTKVPVREPITLVPTTMPGGGGGLSVVGRW